MEEAGARKQAFDEEVRRSMRKGFGGFAGFHMPAHREWTKPGHPDSCKVQTLP